MIKLLSFVLLAVLILGGFALYRRKRLADDWFAGADTEFGLADILRLAVWHARLGRPSLPPIMALPSFAKLDRAILSPEFSLFLLQEGKERIAGIQQLLAN
jgi:hypothetical protein